MRLRVLNWNIFWKSHPEAVLRYLASVDADVMCLQEVTKDSEINPGVDIPQLISELGYHFEYVPTISRSGPRHKIEGIGLFSKTKLIHLSTVYINRGDATSNDASNYNRVYLQGTIVSPAGPVTIATTQLSYSPHFEMTDQRQAEGTRLLTAVSTPSKHYVLAGDFNAAPDSSLIRSLRRKLAKADPPDSKASFPTIPFQYHDTDFTATPFTWRIDYLFATPDMVVINTTLPMTKISDHLPIVTEFEI